MKKEDAIKELELIAKVTMWNDRREAVEMAIKALSKQDDDSISRQDAIEAVASRDETNGTVKVFTGRQVNEILAELPSVSVEVGEWIPCSERLPEINTPVILCGKYNEVIGYRRNNSDWMALSGDGWETDIKHPEDFIAWMSLPRPYEERESE